VIGILKKWKTDVCNDEYTKKMYIYKGRYIGRWIYVKIIVLLENKYKIRLYKDR